MLGLLATVLGASVKLVDPLVRVRASAYNRTAALLDRETGHDPGPELTWQWTTQASMEVLVCAALAGVFKKRKKRIEFNKFN